jgi:hypothetical protein
VVTDQEARITFVLGFIIPLDNPTTNLPMKVRMLEKKESNNPNLSLPIFRKKEEYWIRKLSTER